MNLENVDAIEVDNPYSITFLQGHLYSSGMWFGVAPIKKKMCVNEIILHAQNNDNHSMFNSHYNGKYVDDHLMSTNIFTLTMI